MKSDYGQVGLSYEPWPGLQEGWSREEPINGVKPTAFYINDSKHQLMIYCYDSINDRKTGWEMWRDSDRVKSFFSESGTSAKNLMLIIIPEDEKELTIDSMQELSEVAPEIFLG